MDGLDNLNGEYPLRVKWAMMLSQALEQVEARYLMNEIDQGEYFAQLREIDDKLTIIGLSLSQKPWMKTPSRL